MKRKWLKRIGLLCLLAFLAIVIIPLIGVGVACRVWASVGVALAPVADSSITQGLPSYARLEDQTYLTLPEWYIVYSADEYAAFIAHNPPSQFPYFGAIEQYWRSYYDVCAITREQYPFNGGYHLTLAVIGASFTLEYVAKGLYENTLGRATEWVSSSDLSEEDAYARQVAAEFGAFIHTIPWYEFPYGEKLRGLWSSTGGWGPNGVRKWERKIALTLEYGVKALYAWLIKLGGQAVYAPEDLEIQVWVEGITPEILQREPQVRVVKPLDARAAIIAIPRYEAFTQLTPRLMKQGVRFVEIAGNDDVLVTAFAPQAWAYNLSAGQFLFAMPILTEPQRKRVAIKAPVKSLHRVLADLESRGLKLEHIYDY
jgi:hypothetical protein